MEFVLQSNTTDVLSMLEGAVRRRSAVPLLGTPGSGKSALLRYLTGPYWQQKNNSSRSPHIVYANLWEPNSTSGGRFSTPQACVTFTELTLGCGAISRLYDSRVTHESRTWYTKPQQLYTDRQFTSLFAFVRDEFLRLGIAALIIDRAQLLDVFTLQRLMQLRHHVGMDIAIILSATIEQPGAISEHLSRIMDIAIPMREYDAPIELKPLSTTEVVGAVFRAWLKDLNAGFVNDITEETATKIRLMFWNETRGDWREIMKYSRRARDILGPPASTPHRIDGGIWSRIMGKELV